MTFFLYSKEHGRIVLINVHPFFFFFFFFFFSICFAQFRKHGTDLPLRLEAFREKYESRTNSLHGIVYYN